MNIAIGHDDRGELQAHAEFLERDRYRSEARARLHDGEGKLAPGQEASLLAIDGDQVGLGKDLQETLVLQGLNHRSEIDIRPKDEQVQNIADGLPAGAGRAAARTGAALGKRLWAKAAKLSSGDGAKSVRCARGNEVNAQLGEGGAIDFRELDFQQNFLCADRTEGQHVDDFRRVGSGQIAGALSDIFRSYVTGEDNGSARGRNRDLLVGKYPVLLFGAGADVDVDPQIKTARAFQFVRSEERR